jgi:molybdopterin-guanine dinucleotide biosynthesis protein A
MSGVYGLVVCGGKSTRMGTDKSMLNYHGQPQRYHLYDMLNRLCERTFISCNKEQAATIPDKYAVIVDDEQYGDIGPMVALLTAFDKYPDASFLIVGCDYPHLQVGELDRLIKVSLQSNKSTSLYNIEEKIVEPLISVYQHDIKYQLEQNFQQSKHSLRMLLCEVNAHIIEPPNYMSIISIDNLQQYNETIAMLRNS